MVKNATPIITLDDSPLSPTPAECERCCQELRTSFKEERVTPPSTPTPRLLQEDWDDLSDLINDVDMGAVIEEDNHLHVEEILSSNQQQTSSEDLWDVSLIAEIDSMDDETPSMALLRSFEQTLPHIIDDEYEAFFL